MTSEITDEELAELLSEIDGEPAPPEKKEEPAQDKPETLLDDDEISEAIFEAEKAKPKIRTFIDKEELKRDLSFNEENVSTAYMQQAALFSHYATKAHQARLQADTLKHRLEVLESRLDYIVRKEARRDKEKLSEPAIAARVKMAKEHQVAVQAYNEAKTVADLCKDTCEAFRHRRDMLIQFGADVRQERSGEIRLRKLEEKETPSERARRISGS